MTETPGSLATQWRAAVSDLLGRAGKPQSGIPALSAPARLYLQLLNPVMEADGWALLSAPDDHAKHIVESELIGHIGPVLSTHLGHDVRVAIILDTPAPEPAPEPSVEAAPAPEPTPAPAPQPAPSPGASPVARAEDKWDSTHAPASLDELAEQFNRQQAEAEAPQDYSQGSRLPRETPAHDPNRDQSLNPKHTFDSFVIGSSNRFANGAAVAVAENPAKAYNPLFIWGGSGLGKTHLLHAAGNYAQLLHPGLRVKYVSSEEFTNDYINSLRDDRQESFKRRYRNLDILMVDDIQFLEGKESTQEEFFHTFNALHQANKQIILSSDRPPRQLTTLEDRLRTRFEGGLITDVQPPDLETRIAILMKKAQADGTVIHRDVLELIASRFESSIRELEGALIRVSAYASLNHAPITVDMAREALHDLAPEGGHAQITPTTIIEVTAAYFDIDPEMLTGAIKKRNVAHARQLAMYLCRELTELSLPKIGAHFGGKDHTTVIYADRKIRKEMTEKRGTYDEIQALTQRIKTHNR